jgi:hypothetical protein
MSKTGSDIGTIAGAGGGAALGGPAGAGIGGSIGGIIGSLMGGTDNSAQDRLNSLQALYAQLNDPTFDRSSLTPEQQAVVAKLTPEMMQAQQMQGPVTASTNGQGRDAQVAALKQLQALGQGGPNLQDKADLQNILNQQASANKGQQDAILANANARGTGGSGAALAAQMIAEQGGANTAAQQGGQQAANIQMRQLQALQSAGQAGANLGAQDFSQSGSNANIINAFNQANFANQQGIANQNVANNNAAQQFNISNAQNVANNNVANNNYTKQYNQQNQNNLAQLGFSNQLSKISGQAGIGSQAAAYQNAAAAGQQQRNTGIGQAVGTGIGAGVGYLSNGSGSKPTVMAGDPNNQNNVA